MHSTTRLLLGVAWLVMGAALAGAETVNLSSLDLSKVTTGWGTVRSNLSIGLQPLTIGGITFTNGVGVHARSAMYVRLDGQATRLHAVCGVDDETHGAGSLIFRVVSEHGTLFKSPVIRGNDKGAVIDLDISGVKTLALLVIEAQPLDSGLPFVYYAHADWADARIEYKGAKPQLVAPIEDSAILTPPPGLPPRINGAKIYGARPGHPFLYRIPCTGERPIHFAAKGLPAGLSLDAQTGIVTGKTPAKGDYAITWSAENVHGQCSRAFKLVAGDTLSLTPPMGFNCWYACYGNPSDARIRQAADGLVSNGMADAGYQVVAVDDGWARSRDTSGKIQCSTNFPDMKALVDYIHAKGLKAGIYSSPAEETIGNCTGSLNHEAADAAQFANWGFDWLKYEWWFYYAQEAGVEGNQKTFQRMGDILRQQNRDLGFAISQYGRAGVWKWGRDVGGQSWRTGDDLCLEWTRFFEIARRNADLGACSGPGGWNDPDNIPILGFASAGDLNAVKPSPLTSSDQYALMSLWCLLPAPLFVSGDLSHLDPSALGVLCNPEVIEVDQDSLGKPARVVDLDEDRFLMIKELKDGSKAVGFCNRGEIAMEVTAKWSDLGVSGQQIVRDLWREKDLGASDRQFTALVPRHGVALLKFTGK